MKCSKCSKEAVISQNYSGLSLCANHEVSDIVLKAKKEIRKSGGLASSEKIFVDGENDFRTFALRIFLSELFLKRTDISFVKSTKVATIIFDSKTLDDVSVGLFKKVCDGNIDNIARPEKRTVSPLSSVPKEEVFWYAKYHGWKNECTEPKDSVETFLDDFGKSHPATLYALKNVSDELERRII